MRGCCASRRLGASAHGPIWRGPLKLSDGRTGVRWRAFRRRPTTRCGHCLYRLRRQLRSHHRHSRKSTGPQLTTRCGRSQCHRLTAAWRGSGQRHALFGLHLSEFSHLTVAARCCISDLRPPVIRAVRISHQFNLDEAGSAQSSTKRQELQIDAGDKVVSSWSATGKLNPIVCRPIEFIGLQFAVYQGTCKWQSNTHLPRL